MTEPAAEETITLEYRGKLAIITIRNEKKLNALNQDQYLLLARHLRTVAARDDVFVTVLTGKGRFFSAGADVTVDRSVSEGEDAWTFFLRSFAANNMNLTHAFYSHPKILVTALNGPAVGLSAAVTAYSDFVYAAKHAFLLTPFSSLGLVAEGGASRAFVERLGIAKANEALIMSKKITSEELLQTGYVNKIFDVKPGDDEKFLELVLAEIDERMGEHLVSDSMTKIKELIRRPERQNMDSQLVHEVFGGLERFVNGIPQGQFAAIASGKKRHKL